MNLDLETFLLVLYIYILSGLLGCAASVTVGLYKLENKF
jgi:hypothetical protein